MLVLQGREVDDKDTFRYNRDFSAALFRVKINAIQLKETVEENKKTNDQVLQDRQYQARLKLSRAYACVSCMSLGAGRWWYTRLTTTAFHVVAV